MRACMCVCLLRVCCALCVVCVCVFAMSVLCACVYVSYDRVVRVFAMSVLRAGLRAGLRACGLEYPHARFASRRSASGQGRRRAAPPALSIRRAPCRRPPPPPPPPPTPHYHHQDLARRSAEREAGLQGLARGFAQTASLYEERGAQVRAAVLV
jgi:hypothetical protein